MSKLDHNNVEDPLLNKIDGYKKNLDTISISPFNKDKWSQYQ